MILGHEASGIVTEVGANYEGAFKVIVIAAILVLSILRNPVPTRFRLRFSSFLPSPSLSSVSSPLCLSFPIFLPGL